MKTTITLLFISISSLLSGQYFVTCNGHYGNNLNQLSYKAEKCKTDIYSTPLFDRIPANDTTFITKIKKQVVARIGEHFSDQLELRFIISSRPSAKCNFINYTFVYYFRFDSTFSYRFALAFDEGGNLVGDEGFSFILEHPAFYKLTPICNVLKSLLTNTPFAEEEIACIELEYDTQLKNSVYKIYSIPKESEWGFNGRRIGCPSGKIFVVNAQTGEKIRIEDYKECDRD